MRIYFIRHDKTEWNLEGQFQGYSGDSALLAQSYEGLKRICLSSPSTFGRFCQKSGRFPAVNCSHRVTWFNLSRWNHDAAGLSCPRGLLSRWLGQCLRDYS